MRKHWAVLILEDALARTDTRYHEWGSPGRTVCSRRYRQPDTMRHSKDENTMLWVHRKQAVKFAEPCRRCYPVPVNEETADG